MCPSRPLAIFQQCLQTVPDPRSKRGQGHVFRTVLPLIFLGIIANCTTPTGLQRWAERVVPLFAELREELDRHFLADELIGDTFVIDGLQGTAWNLHEPFQKIADNAGLGTITRPFDNMRMSRSNEVWERWGPVKENLWIGHSESTRRKHYKGELSDEAFAEAAGVMLNEQHPTRAKTHAVR